MKKLLTACAVCICISLNAQTLFTYGKDAVTTKEFLQAYNKNNTGPKSSVALKEYLDLYIASRLKIKQAKERGYDTLPQFLADLQDLRNQIIPGYLTDEAGIKRLVNEAFTRSQKDIHLAHISISLKTNDSATALRKANEASAKLLKEDFSTVAQQYSDDPSVNSNGGDLGFITVFTLPYELENLAYNTALNKLSPVYKSKGGYHIFKNLGERKALGRIKAAQILLAYPPEANDAAKQQLKKIADSLYNRLKAGDDFAKLATQYSNDYISASANGQIPEFGAGQFVPEFENLVLKLKDEEVGQPLLTSHGYHIVKRISVNPVSSVNDAETFSGLKQKVENSDRMNTLRDEMTKKILKLVGYKKSSFTEVALKAYTDSVLEYRTSGGINTLKPTTTLFTIGNKNFAPPDWISYAQTHRFKSDGSGIRPINQVWDEYVQSAAMDYYRQNLEMYNPEFRNQIQEFKEGNLFFEIMQREIWGPTQTDSAALVNYYQKHQSKYKWNNSVIAVIFYANDIAVAKEMGEKLKKDPEQWKRLSAQYNETIAFDSARFEITQIPNPTTLSLKAGVITEPLVNKTDNTASFAYITYVYPKPEPRTFEDARGMVISDYQAEVEKKWIADLKKKYPVTINQKALAALAK